MTSPAPGDPPTITRKPWPAWILVAFWLLVILLIAAGLAMAATYGPPHEDTAQEPMPVSGRLVTDVPRPTAVRQPQDPGDARPAGIVMVDSTSAATATPPSPEQVLPAEVLLQQVPVGKQSRSLNCEFQTASDLAWYYGRPFTWEEIFQYVGHDVGGNPHKGFVGRSFDDAPGQLYPEGYGVYAEPIAHALEQLGLQTAVSYDNPQEWLMAHLAGGRPVMVWTTSGMVVRPVATWTAADGATVKGVPGEHTYLAVGYDADGVWLLDPWDGQRHSFDWPAFLASWDLLDRMALVIVDAPGGTSAPAPDP